MVRIRAFAASWWRDRRGGMAVTFALSLPVLFGIAGVATDYALMSKVKAELQQAADAAAMAGAREIPLAVTNAKQVANAARSYAAYELVANPVASDEDLTARKLHLAAEVIEDFSAVKVSISEEWQPFFMHFVDSSVTPITVSSVARFIGRNNICVLALSSKDSAIILEKDGRLTGSNCGVFSNSVDNDGLRIDSGAMAKATILCSAGGTKVGSSASVAPAPITDCPPVEDPLADRKMPQTIGCDHTDLEIKNVSATIDPGTYCGGLKINGSAKVRLNPGVYVLKDGGLEVGDTASLEGTGVGFFLTGSAKKIEFKPKTHISLSAPESGAMGGLLIFEDRNLPVKLLHKITSDDARMLLGTIYLPVGSLIVDAKKPVADQSAYTAIVAQKIELNSGPNLVLNANYDMTDVPVPAGIAGSSQVVLSK